MRIGVINMPSRLLYNSQGIRTRFFILGLPLFPTSCFYKVSDNLGIEVPLTGTDILYAYAKIHFGLIGVGLLIASGNIHSISSTLLSVVALGLIGFCIYTWVKHSEVSGEDALQRKIFGKAFLYNMQPDYLPVKVQKALYGELLKIYLSKFGKIDWQNEINAGTVNKDNFPLLYTLAYYQKTLEKSANTEAQFQKIAAYLKKGQPLAAAPQPATADDKKTASNNNPMQEAMEKVMTYEAARQSTSNTQQRSFASTSYERKTGQSTFTTEPMTRSDLIKVQDAKESTNKQLLMLFGFFAVGIVLTAIFSGDASLIPGVALIILLLIGTNSAFVFGPTYVKLNRDLKNKQKLLVNVRVRDMVEEYGTAYLMLAHNPYGIKKLTAPAKYYSTGLLNKNLEMYVAKESHTLLEIIKARY